MLCAARSLALDRMPRQHWHLHSSCTWLLTRPEMRLKKANFVSVILPCSWFSLQRAAPASTEPRAERVQQPSPRLVFAYADYDLLEPSRPRATVRRSDPRTMHCLMPTAQRSATKASAFPHVLCPSTALLLWCAQLVSPGAAGSALVKWHDTMAMVRRVWWARTQVHVRCSAVRSDRAPACVRSHRAVVCRQGS